MASTPGETAFAEAAAMVSAGNLAGAEAQLRACLALQPDHQNAELTLANLLIHRQAWQEAEPVLRAHLKRAPTVDGLLMLARVTASTGRILEAERHHLEVLRHVPTNGPALTAAADFYSRHKASREAAKYWKRYIDINPADSGAILKYIDTISLHSPDAAIASLESLLVQIEGEDAKTLRVLEKLIVHKEWRARRRVGLPLYHATCVDDLHFKFAAADVARYRDIATRAFEKNPSDLSLRTKFCYALFATGQGAFLEAHLAPVVEKLKGSAWANIRDRDGGFYDLLTAMTDEDIFGGLPPVETILTAVFGDAPVTFLSCDFRYFDQFAMPLLRSLAANGPGSQVHIHIMDAPTEHLSAVEALLGILELRTVITREMVPPADLQTPERARAYYHAIRFVRFYQLAKFYGRALWMIDVDALFNQRAAELFRLAGSAEVAMRIRPARWEPWNQFSACAVAVQPNTAGVDYFRLIAAYISHFHRQQALGWGIDQVAMYGVYDFLQARGRSPVIVPLDSYAVDLEYRPSGVLWCAAGAQKFSSERLVGFELENAAYDDLFERYR